MSELEKLIAAADKENKNREFDKQPQKPNKRSSAISKFLKYWWIPFGVAIIAVCINISVLFMPVPEDVLRSDAETTLDIAQSSIEEYRKDKGVLPDRFPPSAIASLVQYEKLDDGYRLSIEINGVTLSREK